MRWTNLCVQASNYIVIAASHAKKRSTDWRSLSSGRLLRHHKFHCFVTVSSPEFSPVCPVRPGVAVNSCLDPDDADYRCEIGDNRGM